MYLGTGAMEIQLSISAPHIKHFSMWDPYGIYLLACLARGLKAYCLRIMWGVHPSVLGVSMFMFRDWSQLNMSNMDHYWVLNFNVKG
jgi:hypothetical protein